MLGSIETQYLVNEIRKRIPSVPMLILVGIGRCDEYLVYRYIWL